MSETTSQKLYEELSQPVPKEHTFQYQEGDTELTGYHAQYAIDLLNKVIGIGNWTMYCVVEKEELINRGWLVVMSGKLKISYQGQQFWIEGNSAMYATKAENAYKGARTSTFKQCCRYLGIGRELYYDANVELSEKEQAPEEQEEKTELMEKIEKCKTLKQLQELEKQAKDEGKKTLKKYNDKKLELMEK